MKIRIGFVSNSSSTSFCVMGILEESAVIDDEERENLEKNGIRVDSTDEFGDWYVLGLSIEQILPDETMNDFKTRAVMTLCNAGKQVIPSDVWLHYGGYYNG